MQTKYYIILVQPIQYNNNLPNVALNVLSHLVRMPYIYNRINRYIKLMPFEDLYSLFDLKCHTFNRITHLSYVVCSCRITPISQYLLNIACSFCKQKSTENPSFYFSLDSIISLLILNFPSLFFSRVTIIRHGCSAPPKSKNFP